MKVFGISCIALSFILELLSYYKQIHKTLRVKNSKQVSSSAYEVKLLKYVITIVGLVIYANWVALGLEIAALVMCMIAFIIIIKYKPKNWSLFK
jgi:uncharacterized protein with PQ loop repeat